MSQPVTTAIAEGRAQPALLQLEVIRAAPALTALEPEWRALHERCAHASPFQSPEWLLPWTEAFLGEGLCALAVRRGRRLVGLAPFFIYAGEGEGQLTLLGNGISDRLDILVEAGEAEAVAAAVLERLGAVPDWRTCDLRDLPAESVLARSRVPFATAADTVEPDAPCPTLTLPADPEAVQAPLGRQVRYNLRRSARRLADLGELAVRTADHWTLAEDLAALERLHAARWAARGEAGVLAEPGVGAFHAAAAPRLLAAGLLRLDLLTLSGRVIAAHYGFRHGGCGYSYLHAFDPALGSCSPGALLIGQVLAQAVRDGLERFDFLRGGEAYKYAWGAVDRPQVRRRISR